VQGPGGSWEWVTLCGVENGKTQKADEPMQHATGFSEQCSAFLCTCMYTLYVLRTALALEDGDDDTGNKLCRCRRRGCS
jgi:hypothetical protein